MNYELIKNYVEDKVKEQSADWEIDGGSVIIDGIVYIIAPWRRNRNLQSLHYLSVETESVAGLCSYKATRIEAKGASISEILYGELDVCRWLTNDEFVSVYALSNGDQTVSMILKTKKDILCSISASTTLSTETDPITRHEIVGEEGMISDRCINEHIPSKEIYVFEDTKKDPTTYNDLDFHVDGLSPEEIFASEYIIELIENKELRFEASKNQEKLSKYMEAFSRSLETGEVVRLEV